MRTELWGSLKGILIVCLLLSKLEERSFSPKSVFVWTGIFSKTLLLWTWIFFIRIKKMRFQKYPDTCGRGLSDDNEEVFAGLDIEKQDAQR